MAVAEDRSPAEAVRRTRREAEHRTRREAEHRTRRGEARRFGVSLIKRAAFKRMTLFGPIAGGLGVVGVVLTVLGLRKK